MTRSGRRYFSSVLILLFVTGVATRSRAEDAAPDAAREPDERVLVTATRLTDQAISTREIPARVTVITRDRIEDLGARSVQEALRLETGIVAYDAIGNAVQTTVDWRGFASGTGAAVFVDGARINDPRNNAVALDAIPIDAVERIEVTRGPAAAISGGGAESAVIRIFTRATGDDRGVLGASFGSNGALMLSAHVSAPVGRFDISGTASFDESDGFRENADVDSRRLAASAGYDFGAGRRLALTLLGDRSDLGAPGALTEPEFASDPYASPYNRVDGTDRSTSLATIDYHGGVGRGVSIAVNAFHRGARDETLTTGRAAPTFGGFYLEADGRSNGATFQVTHEVASGAWRNRLVGGVEGLDGGTDSLGWFTSPADPGTIPSSPPSSDNRAESRAAAAFLQDVWTPRPGVVVQAGARWDDNRVRYEERAPDPTITDERKFSRVSLRGGAVWTPRPPFDLYASYGEAFLPPTAEQLFAFPGFGSNRDLDPQRSRSIELGSRARRGRIDADVALFHVDTDDEIVFDPTPTPESPFGRNVNAGRTRRVGAEVELRGRLTSRVAAYACFTATRAEFDGGANDGRRVPLVPNERASVGIDASLPAGFRLRGDLLYVGNQALDNDDANAVAPLGSYSVLDLRAAWFLASRRAASARSGVTIFLDVANALDRRYATRGIYAFDFAAGNDAVFVTPAPERRFRGGVSWTY